MQFGAASIVRRGVQFTHATLSDPDNVDHPKMPKFSAWAFVLVVLTIIGFSVLFFAIQYSYYNVIGTLTMVESTQADGYVAVDTFPSNDQDNDTTKPHSSEPLSEPEVVLMRNTPITSSIRRTTRHLRAHYGYFSRFRGLSLFICLGIARLFIIQFFGIPTFMNNWIGFSIASILADLVLARWELTWIHIVISEPTVKRWWQRAPPLKTWVKIAPAVALQSIASQFVAIILVVVGLSFGPLKRMQDPGHQPNRGELNLVCAQSLFVLILALVLAFLVKLPAYVVLVRVAASMLPEEHETVVPFDRSFGGIVSPPIVGGQGKIGMVEAWKTFDWSSKVRLLKLVTKVSAIMLGVWILAVAVFIGEADLIIGCQNFKEIVGVISQMMGHE